MSSPCANARPDPVDTLGPQPAVALEPIEERLRDLEQLSGDRSTLRIVEDRRVPPLELPGVEEERPVDVPPKLGDRRSHEPRAGERRCHELLGVPHDAGASLAGSADRKQRLAARARRGGRGACSWSTRLERSSSSRRVGSSSWPTTPATREASSTWIVGLVYSGATRTAVCWREVVAPPTSSGSSIPRRSISLATMTISSSDGVISPERPTTSQSCSSAASRIRSAETMTPRSITS